MDLPGGSSNASIYGGTIQTPDGHRTPRPSLNKLAPDKGTDGRYFDSLLRVNGWESEYPSVQKLLNHLSRRTKSESSRLQYLNTLSVLCRRESKTPEQLVRTSRSEAEDAVQSYLDDMAKKGCSRKWVNVSMAQLITFFRVNGFKKQKELELERHYMPVRYRKRPEYIPMPSEINNMVIAGVTPSQKAILLFVYESGLRNSTARAVRYADIKGELDSGLDVVHVPVRSDMKEVDPDAAKGRLEYAGLCRTAKRRSAATTPGPTRPPLWSTSCTATTAETP